MAAPSERRLAAIMFSDIVGYTALHAASEERGRRVQQRQGEILRPLVERYGGEWIQHVGDETLASFPSAVDAANCALAIQQALHDEPELGVRIGIHVGDIVFEGGSVHGDGVNIAARIRPLAEPGGICVSAEVQHAIRSQENIDATPLGEQDLKNVGRPISVFTLRGEPAPPTPLRPPIKPSLPRGRPLALSALAAALLAALGWWALERPGLRAGPIRSLAVLPLKNLSGDPEQEYVADGMTEALIGELAKLGSLSVISRTSVKRYKDSDKSLPEIAEELGVEGVLEGTVLREGDQVRVTARLIDARTDAHIWSDRFDRELSGVLALHADVARAVAEHVRLELTPEEKELLAAVRPVDPRAYDAYLRGLDLRGPSSFVISAWGPPAIEQFERAVSLDPELAEAWIELAAIRTELALNGWNLGHRGQLSLGREAAERALKIDARLGTAHAILGSVRGLYDWDFPGARVALERAVRLSPSDPFVLMRYAMHLLLAEGRAEEAFAVAERMQRVAPFDPTVRGWRMTLFLYAHQYERGLEEAKRARELDPTFLHFEIGMLYTELGRFEEAFRTWIELYERCGPPCDPMREAVLRGWEESGFEGVMRATIDVAIGTDGFSPYVIAGAYAEVGETDEAFAWLERAYREREPVMMWLRVNPSFDPLRSDPRYHDLVRRIGFPES